MEIKRRLEDIVVPQRHRLDLGDLDSLQESIEKLGLLQPLVVRADRVTLVAGMRRLKALQNLGYRQVSVRTLESTDDMETWLRAERDENTERNAMLPTELVSLGKDLEVILVPLAKARMEWAKPGSTPVLSGAQGSGRVREEVGRALGVGHATYGRAKAVVEAAEEEPDKYGGLVEEMDRTRGEGSRSHSVGRGVLPGLRAPR